MYVRSYLRNFVTDLSAAVSKKQYELSTSSKTSEKKQHAPEVNKVCHDTLPSFVQVLISPSHSPSAISWLA